MIMGSVWPSLGPVGFPSVGALLSSCVLKLFSLDLAPALFPFDALDRTQCLLTQPRLKSESPEF